MRKALALTVLLGCVRPGPTENDLARRVEGLNRQADKDRETIRELENRLFIVEDKLETLTVAQAKKHAAPPEPELPVVTKHKAPEPEPDPPGPDVIITLDESGNLSEKPARRRGAARPLPPIDGPHDRLSVAPVPPIAKAKPRDPEALTVYRSGTEALSRRDHAAAIAAFRRFLERWPDHDYADNAQYWLGEAYYDQADYKTALLEFKKVLSRYPDGNKAPDALLKVGYCQTKLGDPKDARASLAQVVELYPKTDAAKLAEKRLKEDP
ncbi:MAG TPA: tol-pal system protein YbgF [Haliangiales bacterium]|nr:tol-pal system protein YbgF [Haliangiales bacterium]